ncbi:hypothetical protein JTB14_033168 [Gonioctena quinquepunctata]|nr:hypothetical protein JTB14_033168 [Gonioctena quinquepunctata]
MFKFGFFSDDHEKNEEPIQRTEKSWEECREITYNEDDKVVQEILKRIQTNSILSSGNEIKYFSSSEVLKLLSTAQTIGKNSILQAEQNHSDLLPAVYEGGLKIWECTHDLLLYLNECNINFSGKRVLDLGCGAGILGIALLFKGAECWFQDYNTDVIQYLTVPNILLNSRDALRHCKCFSGDWGSFADLVEADGTRKFDYILTSETIYSTESYEKLHKVFEKLLKKEGVIFLAAKSFYFGVGGGISLFQDYLIEHGIFKHSTCWKCTEGVQREILRIEFI